MVWYFVKLLILLPLVGGMAFGALWLWRKYQPGMIAGQGDRSLRLLEALPMGAFGKLGGVAGGARGAGRFGEGKLHLNVVTVQDKIGQLNILEAVSVRRRRTEGV